MTTTITLSGNVTKSEAAILRALSRAYAEDTHSKFRILENSTPTNDGAIDEPFAIVAGREHEYVIHAGQCGCLAGQNHYPACKHRAAAYDKLGMMDHLISGFYSRVQFATSDSPAAA